MTARVKIFLVTRISGNNSVFLFGLAIQYFFANSVRSSSFYKSETKIGTGNSSLRLSFLARFF